MQFLREGAGGLLQLMDPAALGRGSLLALLHLGFLAFKGGPHLGGLRLQPFQARSADGFLVIESFKTAFELGDLGLEGEALFLALVGGLHRICLLLPELVERTFFMTQGPKRHRHGLLGSREEFLLGGKGSGGGNQFSFQVDEGLTAFL